MLVFSNKIYFKDLKYININHKVKAKEI